MSLRLIEDKHKYLFVLTIKSVTVASKDTITCRTYSQLCLQWKIACLKAAHLGSPLNIHTYKPKT